MFKLRDAEAAVVMIGKAENVSRAAVREIKAGIGAVYAEAELPESCSIQHSASAPALR
jgi:hypothetical protein